MKRLGSAVLPLPARERSLRQRSPGCALEVSARALRKLRNVALVGFALLAGVTASAQTTVSGVISANTHWTEASSPYIVSGDLSVQGGAVLTIDAGVTIYMAAHAGLTVQRRRSLGRVNTN